MPSAGLALENLTALPAFFRAPFIQRAIDGRHRKELSETARHLGLTRDFLRRPLRAVLDDFYGFMNSYYRCEYVYKNVIANKIFFENHSCADASLLSEFRCGESRADVAIFNGTSTAYEIKTEFDSLAKLPSQIADYRRVFDRIYVVSCAKYADSLGADLDSDVGLIIYDRNYRLTTVRKASGNRMGVSPASIFDCLRRDEYLSILRDEINFEPVCSNSEIFAKSKEQFIRLSPAAAHGGMVNCIRERDTDLARDRMLKKFPKSLKYLGLSLNTGIGHMEKAVAALNAPAL